MKIIIKSSVCLVFVFLSFGMNAQGVESFVVSESPDVYPRFNACEEILASTEERAACAHRKFLELLYTNIRYPALARESGIGGEVLVSFTIDENGAMKNIELIKDIGSGCGDAAMDAFEKVANSSTKWIPGVTSGKNVSVRLTMPVKFRIN